MVEQKPIHQVDTSENVETIAELQEPTSRRLGKLLGHFRPGGLEAPEEEPITDIAANIEEYINFHDSPATKTAEEIATAENLIRQATDLSSKIGFAPTNYKRSAKHTSFLKENDPDLSRLTGLYFHVVEDEAGDEWLLKYAGFQGRRDGKDPFQDLYAQQRAEHEVLAYQIANFLGYPVPETRIVTPKGTGDTAIDNRPHTAYHYINQALDYTYYVHADYPMKTESAVDDMTFARRSIVNEAAVDFRPVFNWVIGSMGDGFNQGIVDQETGTYYAVDLNVSYKIPYKSGSEQYTSFEEAIRDALLHESDASTYPINLIITPKNESVIRNYFEKLRRLDKSTAQAILDPHTPKNIVDKDALAAAVAERAQTLVQLYDQGMFQKQ